MRKSQLSRFKIRSSSVKLMSAWSWWSTASPAPTSCGSASLVETRLNLLYHQTLGIPVRHVMLALGSRLPCCSTLRVYAGFLNRWRPAGGSHCALHGSDIRHQEFCVGSYIICAGYAFSTYGEVAACWIQDVVLVVLIARHMRAGHKRLAAGTAIFGVYCWWLFSDFGSISTLTGEPWPRCLLGGSLLGIQICLRLLHLVLMSYSAI